MVPALLLGVERTQMLPGTQISLELDVSWAGPSFTVRVSARVGTREGSASVLNVHQGKYGWEFRGQLPGSLQTCLDP